MNHDKYYSSKPNKPKKGTIIDNLQAKPSRNVTLNTRPKKATVVKPTSKYNCKPNREILNQSAYKTKTS